jgi:hypothetical protein
MHARHLCRAVASLQAGAASHTQPESSATLNLADKAASGLHTARNGILLRLGARASTAVIRWAEAVCIQVPRVALSLGRQHKIHLPIPAAFVAHMANAFRLRAWALFPVGIGLNARLNLTGALLFAGEGVGAFLGALTAGTVGCGQISMRVPVIRFNHRQAL